MSAKKTSEVFFSISCRKRPPRSFLTVLSVVALTVALSGQERPGGEGFSFRTGVELINVTATVTDDQGRFVSGLTAEDFRVYEDGKLQTIQQFDNERVPVSLGIALDTSGSMIGEKMTAAEAALNRFVFDLLGDQDEVFLYRFDSRPELVQGWTENRQAIRKALGVIKPNGGTAIYDTVAEALPLANSGTRRKKALVIISDGNDTSSRTKVDQLSGLVRRTEVIVYAIGIDASGDLHQFGRPSGPPRPLPVPAPFPGKAPLPQTPRPQQPPRSASPQDRVNPEALRRITDDTGGRTEVIVSPHDLDPATAGIANELSRQYFVGYSSSAPKDGRWHTIDVELAKPGSHTVRARRGFVAN
jgi:Ca-activated chloride channel family protein